jgi:hypothetical protein
MGETHQKNHKNKRFSVVLSNWSGYLYWKFFVQYLERVFVLEVLCSVLGAGSCSGSVVHGTWSGYLFWKCCARYLERIVVLEVLCAVIGAACSVNIVQRTWCCSKYCAQLSLLGIYYTLRDF